MDGLNHLREQSADTFIDKILEEMYSLLIIQIQPEFLLELIDDAPPKQRTCHLTAFVELTISTGTTQIYLETSTFIGGDIWNA